MDEPEDIPREQFSYKNAEDALSEMFNAIPKSKRPQYLGHLNEVGYYMQVVNGFFMAAVPDEQKRVVARTEITEVLKQYLARMTEAE